jgi:carbonic anhydrase
LRKLIKGIINFRNTNLDEYRAKLAKLALEGQSPDALMIACCDSRVAPAFASSDPGDLFVVRNVGNLVAPYGHDSNDDSTAAAIEFALQTLKVKDIIICGHSECGAIDAVMKGRDKIIKPHLKSWLRNAESSHDKFKDGMRCGMNLSDHNELSQINVLQQIEHAKTYSVVADRIANGSLKIHGWWFDLASANVYHYDAGISRFIKIDDSTAANIIDSL